MKSQITMRNDIFCKQDFLISARLSVLKAFTWMIRLCLLIVLFCVPASADDLICPPGQYVLLITDDGDGTIEVYNCHGENTCEYLEFLGPHRTLQLYPEKILRVDGSAGSEFLNLETGELIGNFPTQEYDAAVCGDHVSVADRSSLDTCIYDENGTVVCTLENTVGVQGWEIDGTLYLIMPPDNAGSGLGVRAATLNEETGALEPLAGECFQNGTIAQFAKIYYFGDNYLIEGDGTLRIVAKDWQTLFVTEGATFHYTYPMYERNYLRSEPSAITRAWGYVRRVKKGEDFDYIIYNTDCRVAQIITNEEVESRGHSILIGEAFTKLYQGSVESRTLHGLPCAGTLAGTWEYIPYAVTGNMCWYETEEGAASQQIPEGESLVEISGTFMETRDAADGQHLYDRESGEELVIPEEAKEYGMHLGINCISGGGYVLGRNLEEVRHLSQEEGVLQEWYDGTFFVRMNAIEGFISGSDGHWIAKRYRVKE